MTVIVGVCASVEAASRFDVGVRQYRELEAGKRSPSLETWNRICKLYGWPQTFVGSNEAPNSDGQWRSAKRRDPA